MWNLFAQAKKKLHATPCIHHIGLTVVIRKKTLKPGRVVVSKHISVSYNPNECKVTWAICVHFSNIPTPMCGNLQHWRCVYNCQEKEYEKLKSLNDEHLVYYRAQQSSECCIANVSKHHLPTVLKRSGLQGRRNDDWTSMMSDTVCFW